MAIEVIRGIRQQLDTLGLRQQINRHEVENQRLIHSLVDEILVVGDRKERSIHHRIALPLPNQEGSIVVEVSNLNNCQSVYEMVVNGNPNDKLHIAYIDHDGQVKKSTEAGIASGSLQRFTVYGTETYNHNSPLLNGVTNRNRLSMLKEYNGMLKVASAAANFFKIAARHL